MVDYRKKRKSISCPREIQFISNEFQRNFVIRFCIIVVLGALLSGSIIYLMSKATVTTTFEGARLKIISTADFILPAVLLSSTVVIIFIGMLALLTLLFAYRRMRLSLCQIKHEIEKADTGNLNVNLNFRRKDDEFKILAFSLNKMIQDFKKIFLAIKTDIATLESDCEEFARKDNRQIPTKIKGDLQNLKQQLSRIN